MTRNDIISFFKYSSSQRRGVFMLLVVIIILQIAIYFRTNEVVEPSNAEKQQWLSFQKQINLAKKAKNEEIKKIFPFNPNFITDFKGYQLGMSVKEIDRLLDYRKTNRYVNSAKEFQIVTQVSDSLLEVISPYFKFPAWVNNRKEYKSYSNKSFDKKKKSVIIDINQATLEDLEKIYGIGDILSQRIIDEKQKFGGFVSMEQMQYVWGLSPEVIENLNKNFNISSLPNVKKLPINTASLKELMQFPYFKYTLAKAIVTYRSMNGDIKNNDDLSKVKGFPLEKINIIGLYLQF